ncbi:MAG TPA: Sua5/YciO/YrdC/YwlC family protein [Gaiellaceae bacterium]|jgi:L-threonylcarbamoyladenylate synthase|nr:Sua5/YciO/YrdC/YwlC family protein [Gaiellaceae bacterium]
MAADVDDTIETLRAGRPALLPTDTVYGLCCSPFAPEPVALMYRLKGRDSLQPTALVAASVDALLACVPELAGWPAAVSRALLPGPFTLVLPNPAGRFPWLTGGGPGPIGVRVPDLPEPSVRVVDAVGAVAATSANDPGGPDPAVLDDVPERIRAACAAVDAGRLPGAASTVLDLTGSEPKVLREGAVSATDALGRVRAALTG